MQYLEKICHYPEIAYYALKDDNREPVETYVFSTPQTRRICNVPEVVGVEYTSLMERAMISALQHLPGKDDLLQIPQERFCVFTFLRGGLNFGLREALYHAYGFNRHGSSFMTSQRYMVDGIWHIRENQYRKIKVPDSATMLVGDVVATGTTIKEGFNVFLDYLRANRNRLENLIFFTIGCHYAEKILGEVDHRLRRMNPAYGRTIIVYLEGKFLVAEDNTPLKIKIPGTDLIRTGGLVTPEFALSQYEDDAYPIERCTIYDAGSRSFDIPEYMDDVVDYWEQTKRLAERGFTLYDALKERWPETGWENADAFMNRQKKVWRSVDDALLRGIYNAYRGRWNDTFLKKSGTRSALMALCDRRLAELKR